MTADVRRLDGTAVDVAKPARNERIAQMLAELTVMNDSGRMSAMRVGVTKPEQSPSWQIVSGSLENVSALTLAPSINCIGCCKWHGHLQNGVFNSC